MLNPEAEASFREEDVLSTPHFQIIDEVKKWGTDLGAELPVIDAKSLEGVDTQFIFCGNMPFDLRSNRDFRTASLVAAAVFSYDIEVRFGKPVDKDLYKLGSNAGLKDVPIKEGKGVGVYVDRRKLTMFMLANVAGLFNPESVSKHTKTEEGRADFTDKLARIATTIPRFYRQMQFSFASQR